MASQPPLRIRRRRFATLTRMPFRTRFHPAALLATGGVLAVLAGIGLALAFALDAGAQSADRSNRPARAQAAAALLPGSGIAVWVSGDERDSVSGPTSATGVRIAAGRVSASASREGGEGRAEASARAEWVQALGGLVQARVVERTASASGGERTRGGIIEDLRIGERMIGTVTSGGTFDLDGY